MSQHARRGHNQKAHQRLVKGVWKQVKSSLHHGCIVKAARKSR